MINVAKSSDRKAPSINAVQVKLQSKNYMGNLYPTFSVIRQAGIHQRAAKYTCP